MKICLLAQTLNPRTGAGVFSGHLVKEVRKQNPNVEFSVMTGEDFLKPSFGALLKNWPRIRSEIRKSDIVHALDGYPYGVMACLASMGILRPIMITAVGSGSIRMLNDFGWRSALLRWAYKRATRITAISRYVAEEVKKVLPNLRIEIINHGVDYEFYAGETTENGRKDSRDKYIVTQGEFKRRKGYLEMLPILKQVMAVYPEMKYVIVANTSRNESYQREVFGLAERLGTRDKIIIKSNLTRKELRAVYQNALLYLSLPINVCGDVEGFGLSIMEAAAAGTPAIIGRGSGADDAVSDGQSGFLVDGLNAKEVVEKILSIIGNEKLREKLSHGAKKWASRNGWERKAKQYMELYEKI